MQHGFAVPDIPVPDIKVASCEENVYSALSEGELSVKLGDEM